QPSHPLAGWQRYGHSDRRHACRRGRTAARGGRRHQPALLKHLRIGYPGREAAEIARGRMTRRARAHEVRLASLSVADDDAWRTEAGFVAPCGPERMYERREIADLGVSQWKLRHSALRPSCADHRRDKLAIAIVEHQ